MTLSAAEHLAVLTLVAMLIAGLVASAVTVVRLRRVWRRRRQARALRWSRRAGLSAATAAAMGATVADTVASPLWWLVQRDRHSMWRSVAAAKRAVSVAARSGAPIGDLPALARQLDRSAAGVDAVLRAAGADRAAAARVAAEQARIAALAADIRGAALDSLAAISADVQSIGSAVAVEVEALAAGARAARRSRAAH